MQGSEEEMKMINLIKDKTLSNQALELELRKRKYTEKEAEELVYQLVLNRRIGILTQKFINHIRGTRS